MSLYSISNENKLVTCPYDPAHKMKESRLQLHIAKCKLNNLDKAKKICPFNATHLLAVGEYDHHLMNCPDRGALDRQLAQSVDKNNPYKGRTDVPQYSEPIQLDEDWEIDQVRVELPGPPVGAVLQPREFAKPAERKAFYHGLHQLPKNEKETVLPVETKTPPATPRQPKYSGVMESVQPNPQALMNLGMGRGKPTRIAANFPKIENPEETSYSNVVSGMNNLGLGRGHTNRANALIFDDDDDFPALGCGRGITHQSTRSNGARPKNGFARNGFK